MFDIGGTNTGLPDISNIEAAAFTSVMWRLTKSIPGRIGQRNEMRQSALLVDSKRFGRLLARKLPAVIRAEEENDRLEPDCRISDLFDGQVDVVNRDGLKPYVKPAVTADAIYAF